MRICTIRRASSLLLFLTGFSLLFFPLSAEGGHNLLPKKSSPKVVTKTSSKEPQPFLRATKKARQSVVSIHTVSGESSEVWDRFGAGFLSPVVMSSEQKYTRGSGFVISEDGYIVTNNHVIQNAEKISVQFLNGDQYQADLIGRDPTTDIALLKIDGHNLVPLSFANSSLVETGEWVIAMGNPFGFQASVSSGIISGDARSYPGGLLVQEFFQTDAAINPGNSGGPLVNLDGDVVGMNTSAITTSGGCIGIGFSIPSNLIQNVLKDLRSGKKPQRGHLGILLFPIYMPTTQALGSTNPQAIFVTAVAPESSAGKAGFLPGDLILKLDGVIMQEVGQFRTAIALTEPGKTVSIVVDRDQQFQTLRTTVEDLPIPSTETARLEKEFHLRVHPTILGNKEKSKTPSTGLLVSEIGRNGSAYRGGIRAGMIILSANGRALKNSDELAEELFKKTFFHFTTLRIFNDGATSSLYFFH